MSKYVMRHCPRCGDHFALVVNQIAEEGRGSRIGGYCLVCSYRIRGWRIFVGGKRARDRQFVQARGRERLAAISGTLTNR